MSVPVCTACGVGVEPGGVSFMDNGARVFRVIGLLGSERFPFPPVCHRCLRAVRSVLREAFPEGSRSFTSIGSMRPFCFFCLVDNLADPNHASRSFSAIRAALPEGFDMNSSGYACPACARLAGEVARATWNGLVERLSASGV